tara:strand:+ start:3392 stop:4390 length:999 start_codon:yes stop_codon:yes gene_type:complete
MKLNDIMDHYDDGGLLLKKAFAEKGVPPVIKTAVDLSDASQRHDSDYALVIDTDFGRQFKYPVVDAGNALASAIYFSENGDALPDKLQKTAAVNIQKALKGFGFTVPEEITKTASMELGYSESADDFTLQKLFGLEGDDSVDVLEDAFAGLSPRGKRRLAFQVKEASADFFEKLPDMVEKYASAGLGSDLAMAIDLRKMLLRDDAAAEELNKIASMVSSESPDDVAAALHNFDVSHEITHQYNRVIPDAYASVFGDSITKSASVNRPVEVGGKEYTADKVTGWLNVGGQDKLSEAFGASFTDEFVADPLNVLSSLPVTHKQAIARMIDVDEG